MRTACVPCTAGGRWRIPMVLGRLQCAALCVAWVSKCRQRACRPMPLCSGGPSNSATCTTCTSTEHRGMATRVHWSGSYFDPSLPVCACARVQVQHFVHGVCDGHCVHAHHHPLHALRAGAQEGRLERHVRRALWRRHRVHGRGLGGGRPAHRWAASVRHYHSIANRKSSLPRAAFPDEDRSGSYLKLGGSEP